MMANLARAFKLSHVHDALLTLDAPLKQAMTNLCSIVPIWAPEALDFFPDAMKQFINKTAALITHDSLMEVGGLKRICKTVWYIHPTEI
jgi:hypothetical protein